MENTYQIGILRFERDIVKVDLFFKLRNTEILTDLSSQRVRYLLMMVNCRTPILDGIRVPGVTATLLKENTPLFGKMLYE